MKPTRDLAEQIYFLLYVRDLEVSKRYYGEILELEPVVDVAGITEFEVREGTRLALMPCDAAQRLLGAEVFAASGTAPKAEVYLVVRQPEAYHRRALERGGIELSPLQARKWNHRAAYSLDRDGHVLAFAEQIEP